ncbi:MAG: O-antigen ligase family protein [Chlorobi bacterium]|nr:O-antigen ligase family protein [Chlorobiota bacterium]
MIRSNVNIHSWAYFITLVLIAMSLPLSKFAMSVSEFMLAGLWLWAGFRFRIIGRFFRIGGTVKGTWHTLVYLARLAANNFVDKLAIFVKNKPALILSSIYFLHVLGLFNTSDIDYAFKDLRIKLPLLLYPIVLSTMEPLKYKRFRVLLLFYVLAVLAGSLISFSYILKENFTDIRNISPYISSIRFGLNASLSFFIMIYFIFHDKKFRIWHKIVFAVVAVWLVVFLFLLESLTSLGVMLIITVAYLFWLLFKTRYVVLKIATLAFAVIIPLVLFLYVRNTVIEVSTAPAINTDTLDKYTALGHPYTHDTINRGIEGGRYVGLYLCEPEMREAWNKRSKYDYNSSPEGKHKLKETLIRYLTSKGLRKDASGVNALTDRDVQMIEQGVANYNYIKNPGLRTRIMKILMGYEVYEKTGDPSGSSIMQRVEYLKASWYLLKKHFWLGVGTGDIEDSLIKQYKLMNSSLDTQFMFHAHNQFLSIFITFGVFGFLWFLFALIYPPIQLRRFSDYFFLTFFIIIIWSMLSDDTLETQAGVTLFAFFYTLFLFGKQKLNSGTTS